MIDMSTKKRGRAEEWMAMQSTETKRYCDTPTPCAAGTKGAKKG